MRVIIRVRDSCFGIYTVPLPRFTGERNFSEKETIYITTEQKVFDSSAVVRVQIIPDTVRVSILT